MTIRNDIRENGRWLGPGELAREAGTTIKALRVYEKAGLLSPDRREGGWRLYSPSHIQRLHQILALKAFGLSLKQIADTLRTGGLSASRIMDLQARHLAATIRNTRSQLQRVQRAREQLAAGNEITADQLFELVRDLSPSTPVDVDDVRETVAAAIEDPEEQVAVCSVVEKAGHSAVAEEEIVELLEEAAINAATGDLDSPSTRALADRWLALTAKLDFPPADPGEEVALRRVMARMVTDPGLAEPLNFLRAAIERRATSPAKKG